MHTTYDAIVIGAGLMGAAAARYLANAGLRAALIGPAEPTDDARATVFASHYDEARVMRLVGKDAHWTRLNIDSARAYPALEAESGIRFLYPVGCLYVSLDPDDAYLARADGDAAAHDLPITRYDAAELAREFPDFAFAEGARGLFQAGPAGHIHPRRLIAAQLAAFAAHGGDLIRDVVVHAEESADHVTLTTESGATYRAAGALLAAGAFSNTFDLLPRRLDLRLKSETILLARVSEAEAARLADLPSLLYEIDTGAYEGIYLIRPLRYPDGHIYLKMGCNLAGDLALTTLESIRAWFVHGDSARHEATLAGALAAVTPRLAVEATATKRCIITYTPDGRPYVGRVTERMAVLTGGNGYSAMCSDALGAAGAHVLLHDRLPAGYDAAAFAVGFG
jgi:glycine/D-amino acid oxidase-like deaminating enzyme